MKINIINIVDSFVNFWENVQDKEIIEQKNLWESDFRNKHKDIFDIYFTNWGSMELLENSLNKYPTSIERIKTNANYINTEINVLNKKLENLFGEDDLEMNLVIMVGLYSSNGWVTNYNGVETVFIAAEFFDNLDYIAILIVHELAHAYYYNKSKMTKQDQNIAVSMFDEGFATFVSEKIFDGLSENEYLWFGNEYLELWNDFNNNEAKVLNFIKNKLNSKDSKTYSLLFSMQANSYGMPCRSGYGIGYRFVKRLSEKYPLSQMLEWNNKEISNKMEKTLSEFL